MNNMVRPAREFIVSLVSLLMLTACGLSVSITSTKLDIPSTSPGPTFAVTLSSAATSPHNSSTISVTVDFGSVAVTGLTAADFVVANGAATNLVDTGSGTSFTLDLTPSGAGTTSIYLPASTAKGAADEDNDLSNTLSYTIDTTGPTISISSPSVAYGTSTTNFVYTVTYTDASTVNLTNGSLAFGGTGAAGCSAVVTNGTTTTPTVTISGCTGDGSVNFSILANTAQDALGNQAAATLASPNAFAKNSFIVTFDTTKPGSANNMVELPLTAWAGYNFTVEWGDGSSEPVSSATWNPGMPAVSHTYVTPGVYTVKFKGAISQFQFKSAGDALKITDVKQWGANVWMWNMELMFEGCANMQMSATDAPNLSSVTSLRAMFAGATIFNGSIGHWDTSTINDMSNVFLDARAFNKPIGNWNVSNVTTMESMFGSAEAFNQDISSWNTSNVTSMARMFAETKAFNQPLAKSGTSWDTSKVISMFAMFESADAFNQDISSWVFGPGLNNMDQMFLNADLFNQDLSAWSARLPSGVSHTFFELGAASWVLPKPTFP